MFCYPSYSTTFVYPKPGDWIVVEERPPSGLSEKKSTLKTIKKSLITPSLSQSKSDLSATKVSQVFGLYRVVFTTQKRRAPIDYYCVNIDRRMVALSIGKKGKISGVELELSRSGKKMDSISFPEIARWRIIKGDERNALLPCCVQYAINGKANTVWSNLALVLKNFPEKVICFPSFNKQGRILPDQFTYYRG